MKRGGQVIYSGPLGRNSRKVTEYFEVLCLKLFYAFFSIGVSYSDFMLISLSQAIPGVPKIKDKYNPATWMLEVSSMAAESRLGIDFAELYKSSSLYQ